MNKETYKAKAKEELNELFARLNELENQKDISEAEAKAEYDSKINELKTKKSELETKYAQLEDASEDKWEEAKEAFSAASEDFKTGFSKITDLVN